MHPRAIEIIEAAQQKLEDEDLNARSAFRLTILAVETLLEDEFSRKHTELKQLELIWDTYEASTEKTAIDSLFDDLRGTLATMGLLAVRAATPPKVQAQNGRVFVVHGHDLELRNRVTTWLQSVSKTPIVLAEQPGSSKTVIELIEGFGAVEYAICLLTADDLGGAKGTEPRSRARQNVILEVGYFFALLGRNRVSVVADATLELPSDILGLRPIVLGPNTDLEKRLSNDMLHAGALAER